MYKNKKQNGSKITFYLSREDKKMLDYLIKFYKPKNISNFLQNLIFKEYTFSKLHLEKSYDK
jgi:hypothetical protein